MPTWRDGFSPRIRRIIEEVAGAAARPPYTDEQVREVRRQARAAWKAALQPCRCWPYKVWCDEVRRQLGLRPKRFSELTAEKKRRCSLCWRWSSINHRWEHDLRCAACEGTGYRPAIETDPRQQQMFTEDESNG